MAITIKKYCCVCGCEIQGEDEIYQTCTEGIVKVAKGHYCQIHTNEVSSSPPEEPSRNSE